MLHILPSTWMTLSSPVESDQSMWVATVLESLRLAANPKKSAVGQPDVQYLEYHLRSGQIHPQIEITAAFTFCLHPKTKKEVRWLLGLAGYYWWFMPDLVDQPLTDLVQWTEQWQAGFVQVKKALYGERLLHSPNVSLPFILPTDAWIRGWGQYSGKGVLRHAMGSRLYSLLPPGQPLYPLFRSRLNSLHRMKNANTWINQWYLALQSFKFKVIHRPWAQMLVADFLRQVIWISEFK